MRKIALVLLLLVCIFSSTSAFSIENICDKSPAEINALATQELLEAHEHGNSLLNVIPISSYARGFQITNSGFSGDATAEMILRPPHTGLFTLPALHFLAVEFSRDSDALYVCSHKDFDPAKSRATIYFLRGYGLNSGWLWFHSPKLRVQPFRIMLNFGRGLRKFPLFQLLDSIVGDFAPETAFLKRLAGVDFERIIVTKHHIEADAGVDLNNPDIVRRQVIVPRHHR